MLYLAGASEPASVDRSIQILSTSAKNLGKGERRWLGQYVGTSTLKEKSSEPDNPPWGASHNFTRVSGVVKPKWPSEETWHLSSATLKLWSCLG